MRHISMCFAALLFCSACAAAESVAPANSAPPKATTPAPCGGNSDAACEDGDFCKFSEGSCGTTAGECSPRPMICTKIYLPVCGCDGKTYGNGCAAHAAGQSVARPGACS